MKLCKVCGTSFRNAPTNGKTLCSEKCRLEYLSKNNSGPLSATWKGGLTPFYLKDRRGPKYKEWRKTVFERDAYTCQMCGQIGGKLQADHISPFAFYPELRFEITNGRTLCVECHKTTPTYLAKAKNFIPQLKG